MPTRAKRGASGSLRRTDKISGRDQSTAFLCILPQDQYQIKHNLFAKTMKRVDPSITLLASGAMPDHMTGSDLLKMHTDKVVPDYLGPRDWTGGLLSKCLDNIDMLSEHYYAYSNQRFDLAKEDRVPDPNQTLVEWARQPANYVRVKYEHYQEYLALIPALKAKPVPISISEWAYTGAAANSYKVVLAYAWAFHEMFRHSELIQMATFTFATSLLSSNRTEAVLNPSGLLFKLYRDHSQLGSNFVCILRSVLWSALRYDLTKLGIR